MIQQKQRDIQSISGYDGSASDYDITDTAAALISAGDGILDVDGVDVVSVADGPTSANDGAILAGFTADVEFDVVDDANAVAAEIAGSGFGPGGLDEAGDVVVSGGDVDTAEAADIQQVSNYNASGSDYEISDDVSVIGAGSSVIENDGVSRIEVEGDATALEGVDLNAYNANVDFDVSDTADAIATNSGSLGKAAEVFVVSGGDSVDVAEAEAIQGLAGYQTGASEYEIEDNAAALISAGDNVLTNGNIHVDAHDGAGSSVVDASDGATLASFTADIDFDVSDTVAAISSVLTTTSLQTTMPAPINQGAGIGVMRMPLSINTNGFIPNF